MASPVRYPSPPDEEKDIGTPPSDADSSGILNEEKTDDNESLSGLEKPSRWSMGILNDQETNEVPGMAKLPSYSFSIYN